MANIPFERSFESYDNKEKLKCWDYEKNKGLTPKDIYLKTNNKHWFICNKCNHSFDVKINRIVTNNSFCMYCVNQKLCDDNNCGTCFEKSFASFDKDKVECYDLTKNKETPRQLFKGSGTVCYFNCNKCKHNFSNKLGYITNDNRWCNYCNSKVLCDDDNCETCFNKSFASFENKDKLKCYDIKKIN
jgi:hypothetical protein